MIINPNCNNLSQRVIQRVLLPAPGGADKIEIESFCEQSLMKTSKLVKNKELSFDKIEKVGNEPVYTGNDNGISCNVYAVKENDNIVLLGAGRKEDAIVRIYLHLIWQEDSKTWIPLYYES